MNLAEDYFSKKYFPDEFSPENFENQKSDCQILFFDRVFRRHHAINDPVNFVDPTGLDTNGISITINGNAFGFGFTVSISFNKDDKGGSSIAVTGGAGSVAALPGGSVNFSVNGTNANTVNDLQGGGLQVGGGAYDGVGGGSGKTVGSNYTGWYYDFGVGTPGGSFSVIPTYTSNLYQKNGNPCPQAH